MTPAEHYAEAQQLLDDAADDAYLIEVQQQFVTIAAVHAQLALVGATVLAARGCGNSAALDLLDAVTK